MSGLFITSTGTEIGKTHVLEQLLGFDRAQQRCLTVSKPVISGWSEDNIQQTDTAFLLRAQGLPVTASALRALSPWQFRAPLTPSMAASLESRSLDVDALIAFCVEQIQHASEQGKQHLIEGVGGLMSPVGERFTGVDWIQALSCPALLVCGSYLGALSHTLTAAAVLKERGIPLIGVVVNETPTSTVNLHETARVLRAHLPSVSVWIVPYSGARFEGIAPIYTRIVELYN